MNEKEIATIVAQVLKAMDTPSKTAVKEAERKVITDTQKVKLIQSMNKEQAIEWFGELNRKKPLDISASNFWKVYQMPKGKSHYFKHDEKRLYILPHQIKAEKLGKKSVIDVYLNAKQQLQEKIEGWEKRNTSEIAKQKAIDSLNRQIGEFDKLIHGA